MSRRKLHSRKLRKERKASSQNQSETKNKTRGLSRRSRALSTHRHEERLRSLEAINLYRQGKAKSLSAAARQAGTSLRAIRELVPAAITQDRPGGRIRLKASDPYSAKVEILTDAGALVVRARGSRQRELAGRHRATYMRVLQGKEPPSALEQYRGKKVGGHELISDYARLATLAQAGVLGQLDSLYVSPDGGR